MKMFGRARSATTVPERVEAERGERLPVTDAGTGEPQMPNQQPGYYPGFRTLAQERFWDAATRLVVHKRLRDRPETRFFDEVEARTMRAVVERVMPQEDRAANRRIDVFAGIDERLFEGRLEGYRYADMPPDQDAYKLAATAFEQMAREEYGMPFHELGTMEQERLVLSVHDAEPKSAKELWGRMSIDRFWTMLVADCCNVYYAHPFAWDEIGFGGPAYPRGYMRLEEGEPEPWEVDEKRYDWAAPADTLSDREEAHGTGKQDQSHHGQAGTH
jgi:hypothetical protein